MVKKKVLLASLILGAGIGLSFNANANDTAGQATGNFKITATVPQMCDFSSGINLNFDMGEFVNAEKVVAQSLKINCKANAKIKIFVDLGSNPNSTNTQRRLPLNGEAGDVENYLLYSIYAEHPTYAKIGPDTPYEFSLASHQTSGTTTRIYVTLDANQPKSSVGQYSDELTATIEYQ